MIGMAKIELTENEIEAALEVLKSGALRQGKHCDTFEQEFAEKVGAKYAVTSANGSAALHLFYMAELQADDEVLVPGYTFIATATMPAYHGVVPKLVDVDPDTFLIDLKHAETLITEKTKAICPVHLFGNVCDVEAIEAFAQKHDLKILWDAAQCHGGLYKGQDVGCFSDAVSYSFYPSKNMFVGEGGITCTNDEDLAEKMRFMRSHGQTGKYYHTMLGLNYRMTDVEAAIGREQLKRLDDMLAVRHRNGQMLKEALEPIPGISPQVTTPDTTHAYHLFCLRVNEDVFGCHRDQLVTAMNERGVQTGIHYPRGLHKQPILQEICGETDLPVCDLLSNEIMAIPVHHGLSEADTLKIIDVITECQSLAPSLKAA